MKNLGKYKYYIMSHDVDILWLTDNLLIVTYLVCLLFFFSYKQNVMNIFVQKYLCKYCHITLV